MTTGILNCELHIADCSLTFNQQFVISNQQFVIAAWGPAHRIAAHKPRLDGAPVVPDNPGFQRTLETEDLRI
jgi:hypothetical protein